MADAMPCQKKDVVCADLRLAHWTARGAKWRLELEDLASPEFLRDRRCRFRR